MSEYTLLEETTRSSALGADYVPLTTATGTYGAISIANLQSGGATITSASTARSGICGGLSCVAHHGGVPTHSHDVS